MKDASGEPWETVVYGAGERVMLESIELEVAIEELYRGVSFDPLSNG